jgi:hypothetical protein
MSEAGEWAETGSVSGAPQWPQKLVVSGLSAAQRLHFAMTQ